MSCGRDQIDPRIRDDIALARLLAAIVAAILLRLASLCLTR